MQIIWSVSIDSSGYSSCGQNYILALNSIGVNVKLDQTIVSQNLDGYGLSTDDKTRFQILSNRPTEKEYIKIHHCVPDRFYIDPYATLNIGYTVCETHDIPKRWIYTCNKMDGIFTASKYCKEVFEENGVKVPIFVIPHTLNKTIWNLEVKPLILKNNTYEHKFLFAGDTTDRKGIFELLEVWNSIPNTNNASLTIKGYYNSFSIEDQEKLKTKLKEYLTSENRNKVFFYGNCLDNALMPHFIKSFDYVISPSKGEGFGLFPFESISIGVPAIVTNGTGMLEYANPSNSILIDTIDSKQKASQELIGVNPDYRDARFLEINKFHLREIILDGIIKGGNKFKISKESYDSFVNKFSYETIGNLIVEKVNELL